MEVARSSHPDRVASDMARTSSVPVGSLLQQTSYPASSVSDPVSRQNSARGYRAPSRTIASASSVANTDLRERAPGTMDSVSVVPVGEGPPAAPESQGGDGHPQPVQTQLDYTPPSQPSSNYDSRLPDFLAHLVYHHLLNLPFDQVISHSALLSSGSNIASLIRKVLNVTNLSNTETFVGLIFLQRLLSHPGVVEGKPGGRISPSTSPVHLAGLPPSHLLADLSTTHVLVRRLVILCFHLSNKAINDQPYSTRSWSRASGLSVPDLVAAERDALAAMEWRASVSIEEWDSALDSLSALGHDWTWALDRKGVSVRHFDVAKGCSRLDTTPRRISTESLQDGDSAVFDIDQEMGQGDSLPPLTSRGQTVSSPMDNDPDEAIARIKRPTSRNYHRTPERISSKHSNSLQYCAPQAYQPGTPVRLSFELVRTADVSALGGPSTPPFVGNKTAGPSNLREPQASHLARSARQHESYGASSHPQPQSMFAAPGTAQGPVVTQVPTSAYSLVPMAVQPMVPAAATQISGVAMPMPVHMVAYHGETSTGVRFVQYR
ncbi:hypothetical protein HDU93_000120 [Gonapodya sp. JEL0774]|nr:hypothetical protein HDU93_000120 [Gonapodya sp. JEL0774]